MRPMGTPDPAALRVFRERPPEARPVPPPHPRLAAALAATAPGPAASVAEVSLLVGVGGRLSERSSGAGRLARATIQGRV